MRSERALALLFTFTAAFVGCRDFFVVDDSSMLVGAPDAATDGSSSAHADAATSSSGDGSSTDAAAGFCKGHPSAVFCDDFDDGAALGARWDKSPENGRLDDATSVSPSRSFELQSPDVGGDTVDYLARSFTIPADANLRLELDMRPATNAPIYPFALFFDNDRRLVLNLDGFVNEAIGGTQNAGYPYTRPPADTWHHMTVSIERVANTVEMRIDGAVVVSKQPLANANLVGTGPIKLAVGLYYAGPHEPWTGHFDNVLVTTF